MIGVKSFHSIQWEKRPKTMQVRIPPAVVLFELVLGQLLINSCFCQHSLLLEKKKEFPNFKKVTMGWAVAQRRLLALDT